MRLDLLIILCLAVRVAAAGPVPPADDGPLHGANGSGNAGVPALDAVGDANGRHVELDTGEFVYEVTDLHIRGRGFDFEWTRTYRSRTPVDSTLGNGWDHAYNEFIVQVAKDRLRHCAGHGRCHDYEPIGQGCWASPGVFNELCETADGFVIADPHWGRRYFRPLDGTSTQGRLERIVDANDNTMSFVYDPAGRLVAIDDTLAIPDVPAPAAEPATADACESTADCPSGMSCVNGVCYVPRNRYLAVQPTQPPGEATALRVVPLHCPTQVYWATPPADDEPARLGTTPVFTDWSAYPLVRIADSEIQPGYVYRVQVWQNSDDGRGGFLSTPCDIPTVHDWADVSGGGNPPIPPDGFVSFDDIQSEVLAFQHPEYGDVSWFDLDPQRPNGIVNFADISRVISGFQGAAYPFGTTLPCGGCNDPCDDRNPCTIDYCLDGECLTVPDDACAAPRRIEIEYDAAGRLSGITDFAGRHISYEHHGNGDLAAVIYPPVLSSPALPIPPEHENATPLVWQYEYDRTPGQLQGNLVRMIDGLGNIYLQNEYGTSGDAHDRVIRQSGSGGAFNYHYQLDAAGMLTTVNDPRGHVEELQFDDRGRLAVRREFTGTAPAVDAPTGPGFNRPAEPLRADDPPLFETRFAFNNDDLPVRVEYPGGGALERTYDEANASQRSRGNLVMEIRVAEGLEADQPYLCERWVHEQQFNRLVAHVDPRGVRREWQIDGAGSAAPLPVCEIGGPARFAASTIRPGYDGADVTSRDRWQAWAPPRPQGVSGPLSGTGNILGLSCPIVGDDALGDVQSCFSFDYNSHGQLLTRTRTCDDVVVESWSYHEDGPMRGSPAVHTMDADEHHLEWHYEYDLLGHLVSIADPSGNVALTTYDQFDRPIRRESREVMLAGGPVRYSNDYHYDLGGNLVRVDESNVDDTGVVSANPVWTVIHEYDQHDRLVRTCRETQPQAVPAGQRNCDGLTDFTTTEFEYDDSGNLVRRRSPLAVEGTDPHHVVRRDYDERDLLFRRVLAEGDPVDQVTTRFDYDERGRLVRETVGLEGNPVVHAYAHDAYDRVTRYVDPAGTAVRHVYDQVGSVVLRTVDGEEIVGESGRLSRLEETSFEYDPWNRLEAREDQHFQLVNGYPEPIGATGAARTEFEYGAFPIPERVIGPNGHDYVMELDPLGRLDAMDDAVGNRWEVSLRDANSNPVVMVNVEIDADGVPMDPKLRLMEFDGQDRLVQLTDSGGGVTRFFYDHRDRIVRVTDPLGRERRIHYDGLGRRTAIAWDMDDDGADVDDPDDIVIRQFWDAASRLIAVTDAEGRTTSMAFDSRDDLLIERLADGGLYQVGTGATWDDPSAEPDLDSHVNGYDVHGNRVVWTDPNGTVVYTQYDGLGLPLERVIAPGPQVSAQTTWETFRYDGLSRLVRAADDDTTVARKHDSRGNILWESLLLGQPVCGNGVIEPGETCEGEFEGCDACRVTAHDCCVIGGCTDGRLAACVCDNYFPPLYEYCCEDGWDQGCVDGLIVAGCATCEQAPESTLTVRSWYDSAGNQVATLYPGGRFIASAFDPLNRPGQVDTVQVDYEGRDRLARVTLPNGVTGTQWFDELGRAVRTTFVDADMAPPAPVVDLEFHWDAVGNMLTRRNMLSGFTRGFSYDAADRMSEGRTSQVEVIRQTQYLHDKAHNRTLVTGDADGTLQPGNYTLAAGPPLFDAEVHQYTETPLDRRSYDDNGNLVARRSTEDEPLLSLSYDFRDQPVQAVNHETGTTVNYRYDALGRRVEKHADVGTGQTVRYHYGGPDFHHVVEERDEKGQTLATYLYGYGVDRILSMTRGPNVFFYLQDDGANVAAVTDGDGNVVERYEYGDFGEPEIRDAEGRSVKSGISAIGNPYMFSGRRFDAELGLYWYRTRFYDPLAGRFTSRDTIGAWGDPWSLGNPFAMVGQNPWSRRDPFGLSWLDSIQETLDWAGMVFPPADLANAGISAARGNWGDAGVNLAAMIPFGGDAAKAAKKIKQLSDKARAAAKAAEAAEKAAEIAAKAAKKAARKAAEVADDAKKMADDLPTSLRPGPHAGDSIPARGPEPKFSRAERARINKLGKEKGCHTCGKKKPGTKSGNWVPDHQPPSAMHHGCVEQRLFPHCIDCSRRQGGEIPKSK